MWNEPSAGVAFAALDPYSASRQPAIKADLLQIAAANEQTRRIESVWFHQGFPVDVRHNAKIHRPQLATWARAQPPA